MKAKYIAPIIEEQKIDSVEIMAAVSFGDGRSGQVDAKEDQAEGIWGDE